MTKCRLLDAGAGLLGEKSHGVLRALVPAPPALCPLSHLPSPPPSPLPPQRLQRFSTYGSLKQLVLSIIAEELAGDEGKAMASVQDLHVSV